MGLRRARLDEIAAYWKTSMRAGVHAVGEPGGGISRLITQADFDAWRAFLVPRERAFREDVLDTMQPGLRGTYKDPLTGSGLVLLQKVVENPEPERFMNWMVAGRTETLHGAIWHTAQMDAMLERYRAELDLLERDLPHPIMEWLAAAGARIDRLATWVEGHPRSLASLLAIVVAVLLLLGVVTPAVLEALAELIRAVRG